MEFFKSALCMNWVSSGQFTRGWEFFFKEECFVLGTLCGVVGVIDVVRGNGLFCMATHFMMIILYRRFMAGGICISDKRLDGQTIVITGGNSGIGKETARDLSRRGAKIIMASRDTKTSEKIANEICRETDREIVVMNLDLASLTSIRSFVEELKKKEKKIHMLINNAGVICPYRKTEDGLEIHMGTNHFGHFLLTNLMLPFLMHSEPARIISVSALAHAIGFIPFDDMLYEKGFRSHIAYANTKLANILFTRELARKLKGSNIQVFSLHPGVFPSNIGRYVMKRLEPIFGIVVKFLCKTTAEGAQTTLYCALEAKQDNDHYYFSDCAVGYTSPSARDDTAAERLWGLSEKMVGLGK